MKPSIIPMNHVLRIKRDAGKIELELMRFLTPGNAKARAHRKRAGTSINDAAAGSARLRDAILGMTR